MLERQELAIMRRAEQEANDEAAKMERIRTKLEQFGPEPLQTQSEEHAKPKYQRQALIPRKDLHVHGLFLKNTPAVDPEISVTPVEAPLFRDSITLRHEQFSKGHSDDDQKRIVLPKTPRVKQVRETRVHTPPTLESYATTPGKYSKDLEQEFGDIFFGSSSPVSQSTPNPESRSHSTPSSVPRIEVSSPGAIDGAASLSDEEVDAEEDSSLIIIV